MCVPAHAAFPQPYAPPLAQSQPTRPQTIATTLQQHYARVQDPATYAAGADFDSPHHARIEAAVETLRCRTSFSDIGPPELSSPITVQEVAQAASTGLHNHRAPNPLDQIPNELLKYGGPGMYAALTAFFNMQWELECKAQTPGVIRSLHKRGDPTLPNNYRPITLGSAIDKLYNLVLNRRLTAHLERTGGLHDAQNGFRRDRSALDNLFMLSSTLQARKRQRLPTYLFFLDIEKAYDSVWRAGLMWHTWEKGIRGKMFRVLAAMCASPSSIVSHDGCLSPPFTPGMGWEQGDTLATTMFNIHVDCVLRDVWAHHDGVPLPPPPHTTPAAAPHPPPDRAPFNNLVALMYADEFLGLATTPEALQALITTVRATLTRWRIKASVSSNADSKTAAMAIAAPVPQASDSLTWGATTLPWVDSYKYLGVHIAADALFDVHIADRLQKGIRAARALHGVTRMSVR